MIQLLYLRCFSTIKSKNFKLLNIVYALFFLLAPKNSLSLQEALDLNNSFINSSEINRDQLSNDTLIFDNLYSLGGLNRISEYRAKWNINKIQDHLDDEDFIKLPKDTNKYRFLKLKNSLQVFLVSHQSYLSPMISLGIRVGSSMEPKKFPGLALLFNEIMFYEWKRTSEIIQETPYNTFIFNKNGEFKIKVDSFVTEYYLTVKQEHFADALMKFGSTFKSLNLKRVYLESSMNELQSQFTRLKTLDSESIKQVLRNLSVANHINHGFHFFDSELLRRNSNYDDEALFFELVKFYDNYYSSNLMTLCIVSEKSISELEDYAKTYFDEIPNSQKNLITSFDLSKDVSHPYLNIRKNMIQVKSSVDTQYLTLIFPIPHQTPLWKYKLTEYISFLFTNYSINSLFSLLKKNEFIINIDTMTEINNNGFSNFIIQYTLGSKGEKNLIKIIESTLSFVKLIQEVPISETIINQIRKKRQVLLELTSNYIFEEYPRRIVNTFLKVNCLPIDVLRALTSIDKVDFKHVVELLNYFNYENMILLFSKKEFKKSGSNLLLSNSHYYDSKWTNLRKRFASLFRNIKTYFHNSGYGIYPNYLTDEYFGTKYTVEELPIKIIDRFSNINSTLANDLLKLEMPDIDPNFPRNFLIYTENMTIREYPISLFSAMKEMEITKNITDIEQLSHVYHISTPIEIEDMKVALNLQKMASFTKKICYLPTEDNPDILLFVKLHLPENIPRNYKNNSFAFSKNLERLTIITFLFQFTVYYILPTYLRKNFVFKKDYTLWELQEFFYGIEFNWRGYTSIFPDSLEEITKILLNYEKLLKPSLFFEAKQKFQTLIDHFKLEKDNLKVISLSYQILDPNFIDSPKLEEELRNADIQTLIKFSHFFYNNFALTSSVFGNVTPVQYKYYLTRFIRTMRRIEPDMFFEQLEPVNDKSDLTSEYESFNSTILLNNQKYEINSDLKSHNNNKFEEEKKGKSEKKKRIFSNDGTERENLLMKMNNIQNLIFVRNTFNNINKLPYKYSNSHFFYLSWDKDSKLNIVFLQVYYGYFNEQNFAFLQLVSELNSYKYFLEFSGNNCTDCSLKILPRIILSKYLVLEFKLQSLTKNTKELSNLLYNFFQSYYSRPTKMISKSEIEKAKEFIILLSRNDYINENEILKTSSLFENTESLYYIATFHINILKHINSSCYWKKDYLDFLRTLTYEKFFKYWQYFETSSKLFISYQSQKNHEFLDSIESYTPPGFTKLTSFDSLYDINEQQLTYTS